MSFCSSCYQEWKGFWIQESQDRDWIDCELSNFLLVLRIIYLTFLLDKTEGYELVHNWFSMVKHSKDCHSVHSVHIDMQTYIPEIHVHTIDVIQH